MWNYRIARKEHICIDFPDKKERVDHTYAIHEAYYDKKGHAGVITNNSSTKSTPTIVNTYNETGMKTLGNIQKVPNPYNAST